MLLLVVGIAAQWLSPWWSLTLVSVILALAIKVKPAAAIGLAFLAGFLIWGTYALILDLGNAGMLSERMGNLFGGIGRWGMLGATALLGGILTTLGGWTGVWARRAIQPSQS